MACRYCEWSKPPMGKPVPLFYGGTKFPVILINGPLLQMDIYEGWLRPKRKAVGVEIFYCPVCGEKLVEDQCPANTVKTITLTDQTMTIRTNDPHSES